jgi:hypothetical protein
MMTKPAFCSRCSPAHEPARVCPSVAEAACSSGDGPLPPHAAFGSSLLSRRLVSLVRPSICPLPNSVRQPNHSDPSQPKLSVSSHYCQDAFCRLRSRQGRGPLPQSPPKPDRAAFGMNPSSLSRSSPTPWCLISGFSHANLLFPWPQLYGLAKVADAVDIKSRPAPGMFDFAVRTSLDDHCLVQIRPAPCSDLFVISTPC